MDKKPARGIAAYQKALGGQEEETAEDWLSRLADTDFAAAPPSLEKVSRPPPPAEKPPAKAPEEGGGKSESKYRRVAKFLILIGAERAAKVLENLDEAQVEEISREIASVRGISADEAEAILAEFHELLSGAYAYGGAARGGPDEARRLLYAAFGPEKGETLLRRSLPGIEENLFDFLEDFSGEQVLSLLRDESPAAGAMILSRVEPRLAAAALASAEEGWRQETVRRIGRLGKIAPETLEKAAESLREKARKLGGGSATTNMDGLGALAAILKHADVSFGDKILGELAESDLDLSQNIKERLFTLDDVIQAEDKPIREKLQEMDAKEIAVLIKGRAASFTEKILSNISANRRSEVKMESDIIGPITKKDSEEAIKAFMDWFRAAREKGAILLIGDELVE
jgi:flagellar motor switch protein FliG